MKDFKKNTIRNQRAVLLHKVRKKAGAKERKNSLRRGIRRAVTALLVIVLFCGLGLGGYALLTSPIFVIKEIRVEGNTHLQEERLRVYEERLQKNIFVLNLKAIQEDLLQEPYVKRVFVRRALPDRIYLRIEERTAVAALRMKTQGFLVDGEGRLLETVRLKSHRSLPLITGILQDKKGIWQDDLSQALRLLEALKSYGYPPLSELREIEMTRGGGAVLHPLEGRFEILCGSGDYLQKMVRLKRVIADLVKKDWPIRRIDLRFQDQVVVGLGRSV